MAPGTAGTANPLRFQKTKGNAHRSAQSGPSRAVEREIADLQKGFLISMDRRSLCHMTGHARNRRHLRSGGIRWYPHQREFLPPGRAKSPDRRRHFVARRKST